jgi:amino acid transporter
LASIRLPYTAHYGHIQVGTRYVLIVGPGDYTILTEYKANYVAAELRNPSRQLPLSINTAIPTIIICYVAANAVYYVLLPWNVVSTTDAAAVVSILDALRVDSSVDDYY